MAADDVQQLCDFELNDLKLKLQEDLKRDISKIYTDSLFCDLELVLGNISLHVNSCVLKARAKKFFNQLCYLQENYSNGCELDISFTEQVQIFLRDIYGGNDVSLAETLVVNQLDVAVSPDCDQYSTPLTSPLDVSSQKTNFDLKLDPAYYSIVPLDWEKELAEQDFLIESFRSILQRDLLKTKAKPSKSISLTFPHYRRDQDCRSLLDLKKAVEEDWLLFQEEGSLVQFRTSDPTSNLKTCYETKSQRVKCFIIQHMNVGSAEFISEGGFFDAEDSSCLLNDTLNDMQRGISEKSRMSSNIDTGPDSGLATSAEDIPLDQESGLEVSKSISSSVSSDCCVWDSSTAPTQRHHDSSLWVDSAPHQDNSCIQPDFVDHILEELVGRSQQRKDDESSTKELSTDAGLMTVPKHSFFIDASSLLDETEIQPPSGGDNKVQELERFDEESDVLEPLLEACQALKKPTFDSLKNHCDSETSQGWQTFQSNEPCMAQKSPQNEKPPSLIRSNTFELETEDDRLALLRQDYERRQGSLIFQRCDSGPFSDVEQDLNQHCTSLILPDIDASLTVMNSSLFPPHIVDDEVQTPDSLNNDMLEAGNQEKIVDRIIEDLHIVSLKENEVDILKEDGIRNVSADLCSKTLTEISSPLCARRKTEGAPILSGAAPPLLPEKKSDKKSIRSPQPASLSSAWVVDISDIKNSPESRRKLGDSLSSEGQSDQASLEPKSSSSSLGFFIDLNDPRPSVENRYDSIASSEGGKISRQSSDSGKAEKQNACEFFVDLKYPSDPMASVPKLPDAATGPEKKLFSMFVDFGDNIRPKARPELTSRIRAPLSPFAVKKKNLMQGIASQSEGINGKSSNSDADEKGLQSKSMTIATSQSKAATQSSDSKKSSFFMFIDSEPIEGNKRKTFSSRPITGNNLLNGNENQKSKIQHVRAHSVSSVKRCMNSSTSSVPTAASKHFSSQSLQSSEIYSDSSGIRSKPLFSSFHASLPAEESFEGRMNKSQGEMMEASDHSSHINTGSNGSSACSLETYSVHTPEQSSAADDCSSEKKDFSQTCDSLKEEDLLEYSKNFTGKLSHQSSVMDTSAKRRVSSISENNLNAESTGAKSFVRLSDLDKEPVGVSECSASSVTHRMSRSIPETSWIEKKSLMSRSTGGGSAVMSSSSRSLSRLFPHLSMGSSVGRSKNSSAGSHFTEDLDTMRSSQVSDLSSMQSSAGLEYSTESTDISSGRGSPANQLGDDLLKMFVEGINTDVIVEVGGRRIKAHKCILSSRCQYFAAILSGGWVESAGNVISLQGFSYTVVHFALCHIYSGTSNIPDQISIVELASLADMLSLEGLKDVIMYTLKVKYCHFFHKPCAVCSVGVLECLPLAAAYGLDDIYRKSLRWITKYFVRIWPTKTFTTLPRELIEKCYQQHVIHMRAENVLETILCCDKLISTIPTVRWAEPVFVLTSRLMETCIKYISDNFCAILSSENFLSLGREVPWNVSRFQETLVAACERMPPDQSCRSYSQLCSVLDVVQGPDPPPEMTWHPNFVELLIQLRDLSERTLVRQAVRAARTPGWGQMPTDLRRKIQDAACLVLAPADHASSRYKRSGNEGLKQNSQRSSYSRNLDLHQVKMAMVQHARKTNSADHHHVVSSIVVRKNVPLDRSNTVSRRSVPLTNQKTIERGDTVPSQGRPKTWPAQVKSRYLAKRPNHSKETVESQDRNKHLDAPIPQRRVTAPVKGIFISSSDSSRNSSPAMKRSNNVSSSNAKVSDSVSGTRAAIKTVSNSSRSDAQGNFKEDSDTKSADSSARGSRAMNVKNHSASESSRANPSLRKLKDPIPLEILSHELQIKQEVCKSPTPSQSQSITMSNDSLATVSSSDDNPLTHSEKNLKSRSSSGSNRISTQNSSTVTQIDAAKTTDVNVMRTPLGLSNKKATLANVQRKTPILSSKTQDNSTPGSSSGLMSKRSISHVAKSPILSSTGSRLAIPLRTSRSVSSVPEKAHSRVHSTLENLTSKKTFGKDQTHSNYSASALKRASTGSSITTSSSMAGRVLSSRGNRSNVKEGKSVNCKNTDKLKSDNNSLDKTVHPTVGPRSGTFLKDEPSVLKTPVVGDN